MEKPTIPSTIKTRVRSTCYHEAGHAIVAQEIGVPICLIEIYPHRDEDPVAGRFFTTPEAEFDRHQDAVICFAGGIAANELVTGHVPRFFDFFSSKNMNDLRRAFENKHGNPIGIRKAFKQSKSLVQNKWGTIKHLAEYMYEEMLKHYHDEENGAFLEADCDEITAVLEEYKKSNQEA
jgi:hypothetical protein